MSQQPDEVYTSPPTNHLSPFLTSKPTLKSSEFQTNSPTAKKVSLVTLDQAPPASLIARIGSILVSAKADINEKVLLSKDSSTGKEIPTQRYLFGGFINALGVVSKGHLGSSYFYLGQSDDPSAAPNVNYGLVNVALLISQAAVESVKFDVCDEVSWEKDIFGRYPLANSCGQGRSSGVSHASYDATNQCTDEESSVACPVDPAMTAFAETMVTWEGAPPPLECFPATDDKGTGAWDSTLSCTAEGCSHYDGQVKGSIDPNSIPSSNSFGRNNVEGCCWWGRGAFPRGSAGTCMIGKLNYYLGKRAHDEGRSSARYEEVDFCKDPSVICRGYYDDSEKNAEIRWMMGILYWTSSTQQTLSPTNIPSMKEPISTSKPTTRPTTQTPTSSPNIPTTPPTLSVSSKSDSTLNPTASPVTAKPPEYTSDEVTNLSEEELKNRMNNSNNYCATSLEEVKSKCATTLRTCNFGQPLCSIGHACFGNIVCSAAAQFIAKTEETSSIKCGDTCLRPLTSQECESGNKIGAFMSLSSCSNVRVGEFCESKGECGDTVNVGNCPGGQNVFMRVDVCNSSLDSITSTGENETHNQTASTHVLDGSSIATIPTEATEQQDQDTSIDNAWWRDEYNRGSIRTNTSLLLICNTIAMVMILHQK